MVSLLSILLIIFCEEGLSQSNQEKYCPSADWIYCGPEGSDCVIQPGVKSTTISYGLNQNQEGSFVFWDVSNSMSASFKTPCIWQDLGDPWSGQGKGCCFQNSQEMNSIAPNDDDWIIVASEGNRFNTSRKLMYTRFGINGQYVYRWMYGSFDCTTSWYPNVASGHTRNCFINPKVNTSSYASSTFLPCGSNQGGQECNTNIVPNGDSITLIRYGASPNWVYSYGYNSNREVPCNGHMFKNGGLPSNSFCNIHNATVFPPGVLGSWVEVDSCDGCQHLDEAITEGTTSTSTESKTTTWSQSLTQTVSVGFMFAKETLSYTVGYSVSNMVSQSYSYSSSHTCDAQCGNGTSATWYMYQFQMNAQEYIKTDVQPFQIYTCVWVCNTLNKLPQCPPGYCKDPACQTCIPYN